MAACASEGAFSLDSAGPTKASTPNGDDGDDAGANGSKTSDGNAPSTAPQGAPTSDGVLIVHAANFSSLRLCFSNHMDLPPQPDSKVMPQANVVGVEIGSVVRIDPIEDAGDIYVLRERDARTLPGDTVKKCSDYIHHNKQGGDDGSMIEGGGYVKAATKDGKPLGAIGVKQAEVIAIAGCGSKLMLQALDQVGPSNVDSSACGTGWNADTGNMTVSVVPLRASVDQPTDTSIPIQLYNMAPAVDNLNGSLQVTFGETGKEQDLALAKTFEEGKVASLNVDQKNEASYGKQAFNVKATLGVDTVTATQTLADVQHLSSPTDNPTTYYRSASNYALLVLGNPGHKAKLANGDPNPAFNPLRTLHILAVPVLDPNKPDAGADASAGDDAGQK